MKFCKDCRAQVRDFQIYCPQCSSDLYARRRAAVNGFLRNLDNLDLRVAR